MLKRRIVLAILFTFLFFLVFVKPFAILTIDVYQSWISPHKGFHCAYASLHKGSPSCSEYGKQAIGKFGVIDGLLLLQDRFELCRKAAYQIAISGSMSVCDDCATDCNADRKCCRETCIESCRVRQ